MSDWFRRVTECTRGNSITTRCYLWVSTLRSRPWARRPNWPKGRVNARPLDSRVFIKHVPCIPAMFQKLPLLPQNPAAARCPPVGLQPAQKNARFSTSSSSVIFESGQSFLGHNFTHSDHFKKPNTLCKLSFCFFKILRWRVF